MGNAPERTHGREAADRLRQRLEGQMSQTLGCETITTKQETIANLARQAPGMVLSTLAHHIDLIG